MAAITIKGKIRSISQMQTIAGSKPFQFKEMILETELDTKYPQVLNIQFAGKAMDNTDSSNAGDTVEVDINLKGRESNGKVYNTLSGWKVKLIEKGPASQFKDLPDPLTRHEAKEWANTQQPSVTEQIDDLPF